MSEECKIGSVAPEAGREAGARPQVVKVREEVSVACEHCMVMGSDGHRLAVRDDGRLERARPEGFEEPARFSRSSR